MTVWLLWYNDDGDYYQKVRDLVGVFSTRGKVDAAIEKEQRDRRCGTDSEMFRYLEIETHEVL
jgi:hypothetical protein